MFISCAMLMKMEKTEKKKKISHFIKILVKKSLSPFNEMRKLCRGGIRLAIE